MKPKTHKAKQKFKAPVITEATLLNALAEGWHNASSNTGGRTALELAEAANLHVDTVRKQLKIMLKCGRARVGWEVRRGIDTMQRKVPVYFLVD